MPSQPLIPSRPSRSGKMRQRSEREGKTDIEDTQSAITRRAAIQERCQATVQGRFSRGGCDSEKRRATRVVQRYWGSGITIHRHCPFGSKLMLQHSISIRRSSTAAAWASTNPSAKRLPRPSSKTPTSNPLASTSSLVLRLAC